MADVISEFELESSSDFELTMAYENLQPFIIAQQEGQNIFAR